MCILTYLSCQARVQLRQVPSFQPVPRALRLGAVPKNDKEERKGMDNARVTRMIGLLKYQAEGKAKKPMRKDKGQALRHSQFGVFWWSLMRRNSFWRSSTQWWRQNGSELEVYHGFQSRFRSQERYSGWAG